ncbi:MAG TPA: hypothetical protein VI168_16375 [Croceibacterium sp.]
MALQFKRILAACALLCAAAGAAETLPVRGVYPAGSDAAASLGTIAVEPFGGVEGQQLGIAVADRLRAVTIDGAPYFRIVPSRAADEIDAVLQGTAGAEASRRESGTREKEVCVERNEDRDCIRKEKQEIPCWDQVVRLDATVRLVAIGGELIHAFDRSEEQAQRFCQGDDRPSTESLVRQLAARYADGLRGDLAPVQRSEQVRVMETRKGLSRDDGRAFREAVRLTKDDPAAACAAWSALEAANPDNAAVLFNRGLCAESSGELYEASDYYRRVIAGGEDTGYARQGAARIEGRWRANAQLESRHRP